MNIMYISHEFQLNGASRSLLELIHELKKKHNIYVLTGFKNGPFLDELKKENVNIIILPYYRWIIKKKNKIQWLKEKIKWYIWRRNINFLTILYLCIICKKYKIDIIHTNSIVIDIGSIVAKLCGIVHIWHIREFADLDFDMYPYVSDTKFKLKLSNGANSFICNSHAVANHFSFLPDSKVFVVYNGISCQNYILEKRKQTSCVHFLIAGRYSIAKGQDLALKACERLIDCGIRNFVLHIAGSMTEMIKVPNVLAKNIEIHGEVKNMVNLRKKIDVELVCSRAEAFGRVTIEAMMGGIPVIGSNTGGTIELIQNNVNGLLFEYNNISDLAEKMHYMIVNNKERIRMGINAQAFAKKFNIKNCVSQIEHIYYINWIN